MKTEHRNLDSRQVSKLIRNGEAEEALDIFLELLSPAESNRGRSCLASDIIFKNNLKIFKEQIRPILSSTYRSGNIFLKFSIYCVENGKEAKGLRYFKRSLNIYKNYLSTCDNPNGLLVFDFKSEVLRGFVNVYRDRNKLEFLYKDLIEILDIIEPKSTHPPDMIVLHEIIAQILSLIKEPKKALKQWRKALKVVREDNNPYIIERKIPIILIEIGMCHESLKRYDIAIKTYEQIFKQDSKHLTILTLTCKFRIAKCLIEGSKDYEKAKVLLISILVVIIANYRSQKGTATACCTGYFYSLFNHFEELMQLLHKCYQQLGLKKINDDSWRNPKTDQEYREIVKLTQKHKGTERKQACKSLHSIRFWEFMEAWLMYVKQGCFEFNNWEIYEAKFNCYISVCCTKYLTNAIESIEKAIKHSSDQVWIDSKLMYLACIYERYHIYEESLNCVLNISDQKIEVVLNIGIYLSNLKRSQEALQYLSKVLEMSPLDSVDYGRAILAKVQCLLQLDHHSEALQSLNVFKNSKCGDAFMMKEADMMRGHVYMRQGKHSEAQKTFLKAKSKFRGYAKAIPFHSTDGIDDGVTNMIYLVINASFMGLRSYDFMEMIFEICKNNGKFLAWSMRMCNEEERKRFFDLFFRFTKQKRKRGNGLYRNSVLLSSVFGRVKRLENAE